MLNVDENQCFYGALIRGPKEHVDKYIEKHLKNAYIRENCTIGNNAKVGSFVELKNVKIGDNVVLHTEWSGDKTGRIEQMEYDIRSKKIGKVVQRISG